MSPPASKDGLPTTSVIFDGVYLLNDNPTLVLVSYWMITAGLMGGLAAAVPGWIDWLSRPIHALNGDYGLMSQL